MTTLNCYGVDCAGWKMVHERATPDMLGLVPGFISDSDPRSAKEQFDERYAFGGWKPIAGFKMLANGGIAYPGDPVLPPIAERKLRDERVVMYPSAIFAIIQPDGGYEIARMD